MEGDDFGADVCTRSAISIHALRVEGDDDLNKSALAYWRISIHALRVEGDEKNRAAKKWWGISIHALRVEGDHLRRDPVPRIAVFLSTPSGWRATPGLR